MFREAKPREISTVECQQKILFPEGSVIKYFIIYQKSKKWQIKADTYENTLNILFLKLMTLNLIGTQKCQFCPKVASSRYGACDFFCYSPVNNALFPSRADTRDTI